MHPSVPWNGRVGSCTRREQAANIPSVLHRLVLRAVDNPGPRAGRGGRERYDSGMARQRRAYTLPVVVELAAGAWRANCPTLPD